MSWDSKVLWTEGLFLQPHHFQQSDRYMEAMVGGLARRVRPYCWGLSQLEIDDEVLKVGQFALKGIAGLTHDGAAMTVRPLALENWSRHWVLTCWSETTGRHARLRLDLIEAAEALPELFAEEPGKRLSDAP